jgi:serine/threonine protein kinase
VLHRDLKPANVLEVEGVWQLADFGMSRDLLESTGTYTFRGWGTWPYLAPELWSGQPATVKSDLYAFGVLAYEVLTGARPFTGAGETTLMRQHQQEAPAPLPPSVPSAVSRVVLRLLAKEPARRPQDARAVVEALDAAMRQLGAEQEALRKAAFKVEQRHSIEDAERAAVAARLEAEAEQVEQALADLHSIIEEGAERAQAALPELEFRRDGLHWYLIWDQNRVAVGVWARAIAFSLCWSRRR